MITTYCLQKYIKNRKDIRMIHFVFIIDLHMGRVMRSEILEKILACDVYFNKTKKVGLPLVVCS